MASLARVGIAPDRMPALVRELNGILLHMNALQAVDLSSVSVDAGNAAGMPLRDDVVAPVSLHRSREQFAPAMRDGFFLVPRLDTHGASNATGEDES
jgi:aspartyl-tRNA(Asn)/glutamyl-tRNA(Gln) amidotransferase subunit C